VALVHRLVKPYAALSTISARHRPGTWMPTLDRFEQCVGSTEKIAWPVAAPIRWIGGSQTPLAVLADDAPPQILDANLQPPAAGRALLHEIRGVGHGEASYHRTTFQLIGRLSSWSVFCQFHPARYT
jgi:hypothetical protein